MIEKELEIICGNALGNLVDGRCYRHLPQKTVSFLSAYNLKVNISKKDFFGSFVVLKIKWTFLCFNFYAAFNEPDLEKKPTYGVFRPPTGALAKVGQTIFTNLEKVRSTGDLCVERRGRAGGERGRESRMRGILNLSSYGLTLCGLVSTSKSKC